MKVSASIRTLSVRVALLIEDETGHAYVAMPLLVAWDSTLMAGPRGEDAFFSLVPSALKMEPGISLADMYVKRVHADIRAQLRAWLDATEKPA